jgi:hypothetical protein
MGSNPKTRFESLVVQEIENETMVYDLKVNKAYLLNEISQQVWQLCDGSRTTEEISQVLSKSLKTNISEDLIWLALDGFRRNDLLEKAEEVEIDFGGLTRRQVIKKIGFASLAALPAIAIVTSPTAVQAASCGIGPTTFTFPGGQPCVPPSPPFCGPIFCDPLCCFGSQGTGQSPTQITCLCRTSAP